MREAGGMDDAGKGCKRRLLTCIAFSLHWDLCVKPKNPKRMRMRKRALPPR